MRRLMLVAAFAAAIAALAGLAVLPVTGAGASSPHATVQVPHSTVNVMVSSTCSDGHAYCFTPSTLAINDGDTVTWTNQSGVDHVVYPCDPGSCNGTSAGSGTDTSFTFFDLQPGASVSHTFHGAGVYNYFCAIHGYAVMHGYVAVAASTPPTTQGVTTTVAPTSTSSPSPGSTSGSGSTVPTTSVSAAPATASDASAPAQLAHTGSSTRTLSAVAAVMLLLGLGALLFAARGAKRGRKLA